MPQKEDVSHIWFEKPDGSSSVIWVWVDNKTTLINFVYNNVLTVFVPAEVESENVKLSINDEKIVSCQHGMVKEVKVIREFQKAVLATIEA